MVVDSGSSITRAAELLSAGQLVAFPTETVYGLGACALDENAVARVFEAKNRPRFDPLIVHVADASQIESLVAEFPDVAVRLAERFWPGPLTLVVPKSDAVPDLVTAGLQSVAVRVPAHPVARELLDACQVPVAAPSANRFGAVSPTTAAHVIESLGDRVDYVLDGGPCRIGLESTVIGVTERRLVLLRPGGLPVEEIESVVGFPVVPPDHGDTTESAKPSPGMLSRHYAPRTPIRIVKPEQFPHLAADSAGQRCGALLVAEPTGDVEFAAVEVLSSSGDLTECARNFFSSLRRLDAQSCDVILATPFPEHGLGRALNDRLRRAARGSGTED